jgi:tetratricopeptide (TPR) repeat protein
MAAPGAILLFSLFLVEMMPAEDSDVEIQRHYRAARQAQETGSFEIAVQEYLAIIRLDPKMPEVYFNLGLAYFSQGKNEESAGALEKASQLRPHMRGVDLYLGMDYVKLARPEKAVSHLLNAIQTEPASKEAQMWLGTALWDAGRHTAALERLQKSAAAFPSDPDVLFVYGEACRKAANEDAEGALSAASGTALAHQIYGDIYIDQHAWDKAAGHYHRALEIDPHWSGAHLGLGRVYLVQNKIDEASAELKHELEADPSSAAAEALLAKIALLEGRPQDALPRLDAAVGFDFWRAPFALGLSTPEVTSAELLDDQLKDGLAGSRNSLESANPSAARSLALATIDDVLADEAALRQDWADYIRYAPEETRSASLYQQAQSALYRCKYEEAEVELKSLLADHPKDPQTLYLRAQVYAQSSLSALGQLLTAAPGSYRTHQLLAQTYESRNESDKALAEYRIVEQMAPTLPGLHFSIGHMLWVNGDPNQAMEELKQELQLNPDNPETNAEMGTILVSQHEAADAVSYLERALKVSPDLLIVHLELGKAFYLLKEYPKAEVELKQAIRNDNDGDAHYQLGVVYRTLGKQGEAAQQFEASRVIKARRLAEAELKPMSPAETRP